MSPGEGGELLGASMWSVRVVFILRITNISQIIAEV